MQEQIAAIGDVTLEDEAVIASAEAAYSALTDEQKGLVENAGELSAAKEALNQLKTEAAAQAVVQDPTVQSPEVQSAAP